VERMPVSGIVSNLGVQGSDKREFSLSVSMEEVRITAKDA
jgi:hypothetical protein